MHSRRAVLSIASLLALIPLAAQQPDPVTTDPVTTLHSTARVVVLDVVVSDGKGDPAKGLTQSDFTLYEDGVPQKLLSFTEHDATVGAHTSAEPALPPNTFAVAPTYVGNGSSTVVVFGHLDVADAPWARKQLQSYLESTQPAIPMAIVVQDIGTHLIQPLTSDRRLLLAAVSSDRIFSPNTSAPTPGYRPGFTLQRYLANIPGHINLIWFATHGGGAHPFPDIFRFVDNAGILQLSRIALFPMDAHGVDFYDSGVGESLPGAEGHLATGVVGGVMGPVGPGYTFGAGGATFFNTPLDQDLATKNGGRSYHSNHSYVPAITEVVNTGAHYYTISYTPTNRVWDNKYRSIRLEVPGYSTPAQSPLARAVGATDKNEFKLMYRRGYYARAAAPPPPIPTSPDAAPRSLISQSQPYKRPPTPIEAAMAFGTPTPTDMRFTVSITPLPIIARTGGGAALASDNFLTPPFQSMTYRNFQIHYRIAPEDLKLLASANGFNSDDLRFVAVVYRDDGVKANSIVSPGHVAFDAANYAAIMSSPFGFDQEIAVPVTGAFYLRAAVQEMASGRIGSIELPIAAVNLELPDPQPPITSTH